MTTQLPESRTHLAEASVTDAGLAEPARVGPIHSASSAANRRWSHMTGPAAALGGCVLVLLGLNGPALLILLALCAGVVPASTVVRRTILAIPALFGLTACVLTVAAVLDRPVEAPFLLAGYLLVAGALWVVRPKAGPSPRFASAVDVWASAGALATFVILYRPFMAASPGQRLAALSYSTDTGTHLQLVEAVLRHRGYVTFHPEIGAQLTSGLQHYPSGLAGNLATVVRLIAGPDPESAALVSAVAPLLVGGYALLVWCATAVVLRVVEALSGRLRPAAAAWASLSLSLTVLLGFNVILAAGGYHTQAFATAALLAMLVLLLDRSTTGARATTVLALIAVGAMQCWYLLAPLFLSLLLVALARRGPRRLHRLAVVAAAAPFAAFPVITGPRFAQQVTVPGMTPLPNAVGIVGLLLAAAVATAFVFWAFPGSRRSFVVLMALLPLAILLVVAVGTFQIARTGATNYYFVKLLYTTMLLGAILTSAAMGVVVDRISRRPQAIAASARDLAVAAVLLVGSVPAVVSTAPWAMPFLFGTHPPALDGAVLDAYLQRHPRGMPADTDAWVLDGCSRFHDQLASKWTYDLSMTWNRQRERTWGEFAFSKPDDVEMLARRSSDPDVAHIELYVHRTCEPDAVATMAALPKTEVIRVP